jgi:hypothetical protein
MLLDAALVALIVGAFAGGRMARLRDFDLRAPSLFILAAMVKVALAILGMSGSSYGVRLGTGSNILSYLILVAALIANRHLWPMRVAAVGVFLNFLVIAANGGSMPVDRALAERAGDQRLVALLDSPAYAIHKPITPQTRLTPLSDVLPLPRIIPQPTFIAPGSAGDIIVTIAACWLIFASLGAFGLGRARAPTTEPTQQ